MYTCNHTFCQVKYHPYPGIKPDFGPFSLKSINEFAAKWKEKQLDLSFKFYLMDSNDWEDPLKKYCAPNTDTLSKKSIALQIPIQLFQKYLRSRYQYFCAPFKNTFKNIYTRLNPGLIKITLGSLHKMQCWISFAQKVL